MAPVAAAIARQTVLRQNGPRPGRDDRCRHVDGVAGARPEDAGLLGRLVRTGAPQLVGPVGAHDDERRAGVVGLEHGGVQVGDGGAGRRDHHHRRTGPAGQAQGEEPGAALVDPHVQAEPTGPLGGEHGIGQRCRPGAGAQDDLADAVPHQLVDQDRREGGGRGHERGFCHPLSTRSSDTERTGRPSTPPAEACQASRPATVPRGAPSATRTGRRSPRAGGCARRPARRHPWCAP